MGIDVTQLGVSGVIVAMLLIAVKVLWSKYQDALKQRDVDREQVLPAMIEQTAAMREFTREAAVILDRRTNQ